MALLLAPALAGSLTDPLLVERRVVELAAEHPLRAELVDLGSSWQGRPLLALRMGPADAPAWRIQAAQHGDEPVSALVALAAADALLQDLGPFQGVLDERQVWLLPAMNPDGLALGLRANAADVDLNRNFDVAWSASAHRPGPRPFSEPESRALRTLSVRVPFVGGMSLHAGASNISYVYNHTVQDSVEEEQVRAMATTYAARSRLPGFEVLQGGNWYITTGDSADWAFVRRGILDFTVELSDSKAATPDELDLLLSPHLEGMAALLLWPMGLQGRVLDAERGFPLEARLTVEGETASFPNDPLTGAFSRPLDPGEHLLRVEAPGYRSSRVLVETGADSTALELTLLRDDRARVLPIPRRIDLAEGAVLLELPASGGSTATLSRPGFLPRTLPPTVHGFLLETQGLAPGLWTLETDLAVSPRGLVVSDQSSTVNVQAVNLGNGEVHVRGEGFGAGSRLYASSPRRGHIVALALRWESPTRLTASSDAVPRGTTDLLVVSNGSEHVVENALVVPLDDTGDTASGGPRDPSTSSGRTPVGYRSCQHTPSGLPWLVASVLLLARRRK